MSKEEAQMRLTAANAGCWVDGSNGIYMSERIQEIANEYGWGREVVGCGGIFSEYETEGDDIQAAEEATEFMQQFAPEGYCFGWHPDWGDWGMYSNESEEE